MYIIHVRYVKKSVKSTAQLQSISVILAQQQINTCSSANYSMPPVFISKLASLTYNSIQSASVYWKTSI